MPINFIPNDPTVTATVPMRRKTPRTERASNRAGFTYGAHGPAKPHAIGSPDFLFWQCREAALAAVQVWEKLHGTPLTKWARSTNRRVLDLLPDSTGEDLNAYYDGQSVAFFHYQLGTRTFFSGASTEVVAHEVGHALLDSIRPDLWDSLLPETGAFHEAFGDCIAMLTVFADSQTVAAVLKGTRRLNGRNVIETFGEDLARAVKVALGDAHPASKPRRALNSFQWQLPSDLPTSGGPDVLTSEVHSFARVFTGVFYDLIRNLLAGKTSAEAVRKAAATAGRLLIAGAKGAPLTARFYQAVGRVMMLEDRAANGGMNDAAIADAFAAHGILLGSSAMLQPVSALEPQSAGSQTTRAAMTALGRRLGGEDGREAVGTRRIDIGGSQVTEVTGERRVTLTHISERLAGVVAWVPNTVLVGDMTGAGRSAILGGFSDPASVDEEVRRFVRTLVERGRIDFAGDDRLVLAPRAGARGAILTSSSGARSPRSPDTADRRARLATHTVVESHGNRVLQRARFACGPGCCGAALD